MGPDRKLCCRLYRVWKPQVRQTATITMAKARDLTGKCTAAVSKCHDFTGKCAAAVSTCYTCPNLLLWCTLGRPGVHWGCVRPSSDMLRSGLILTVIPGAECIMTRGVSMRLLRQQHMQNRLRSCLGIPLYCSASPLKGSLC